MHGRVLNGELYTHRTHKLIYLHFYTELFRKGFLLLIRTNTGHRIFTKQFYIKTQINFVCLNDVVLFPISCITI